MLNAHPRRFLLNSSETKLRRENKKLSELKGAYSRRLLLSVRKQFPETPSQLFDLSVFTDATVPKICQAVFLSAAIQYSCAWRNCFSKYAFDLCPIKQEIHAHIKPQHDHDQCRQTSVHITEIWKKCKIQRKEIGKQ